MLILLGIHNQDTVCESGEYTEISRKWRRNTDHQPRFLLTINRKSHIVDLLCVSSLGTFIVHTFTAVVHLPLFYAMLCFLVLSLSFDTRCDFSHIMIMNVVNMNYLWAHTLQ